MKEVTKETYVAWYENMLFWRKFEDKLAAVYIQQKVRGFLHLYNGQEAVLAGSLHAMDLSKDRMITAYRNHVQPIGMGVDPKKVMAELYGKAAGTSQGLGGSMHIFSKEHRFHGGHGIVGAQIELLLPIDACDWRILDSFDRKKAALFEPKLPHSLNWRHGVDDSYVSYFDCFGSTMAVGIARLELQAWIDLFEMADLSLHRIDWSLHAAFRGFVGSYPGVDANVAWMIEGPRHHRLLLMRHGVPEVDRSISQLDSGGLLDVVGTIEAWQLLKPTSTPVQWLFTPSLGGSAGTESLHDWAQSSLMPIDLPAINLSRWDVSTGSELLDPFVSLGFAGLGLLR